MQICSTSKCGLAYVKDSVRLLFTKNRDTHPSLRGSGTDNEGLNGGLSAGMAELVDVQDLGSCVERRTGSSPVPRTI